MAKFRPHPGIALIVCGSTLLSACAGPARPPASASAEKTAAPNGALVSGVVVAIRPLTGGAVLSPGATAVLAALQVPPPAQPGNATEFVIQRSDGSIAAVVLGTPAASPTASLSAAAFSVGDPVELLTGDRTELIHANP